jgi:hypothetical protein
MIRYTAIAFLPLLAVACAPMESDEEFVAKGPPVKGLGEPVSCIPITQIRQSVVRDDRKIDFEMAGRKVYRNTLPQSCPSLGFREAFTYSTSISQLCNTEITYVFENVGGQMRRGAGCGLGKFVPVEYAKYEAEY